MDTISLYDGLQLVGFDFHARNETRQAEACPTGFSIGKLNGEWGILVNLCNYLK